MGESSSIGAFVRDAEGLFLLRLNDRLRPLADPDQIQFEAARALGQHLGASRVGYAEILPDDVTSLVTRNYIDGVRSIEGRYRVEDYSPTLLPALRAGRTVVRGDVAADLELTSAERAAHEELQVGATVDVPLVKEGRLIAVLFMHFRQPHAFSAEELALLEMVGTRTWDAVERARAEAARQESEARLRLALEVAELGTWSWNLETGTGDLDERGAEIVCLRPGDLENVAEAQLARIHPDDLARVEAAIAMGIADGRPFDLAYRVRAPDGGIRHVASRARVVNDGAGRAVRLVGTNRDVTAEREAAEERERLLAETEEARRQAERARAEAEAANRAKSEFLAVMSHELRTPLNAIGGYAELLEMGIRGPVNDQQRHDLHRVQSSQRHLLGLINEVLNYAKLETGTVRYDLVSVRVRDALGGAEALVAPQAQAKGLALVVMECPPTLSVRADIEKLRQILVNLLSNAIKFTLPGGRVEVWCDVGQPYTPSNRRTGDGVAVDPAPASVVRIGVRDTGIGIAPDQLERIFEPFVQVRSDFARTAEGTGLGLAISRNLALAMGGDVTVTSAEGVGSTFTLTLPRA